MQEQQANQPAHDPFDIFSAFGFGGMGGRRRSEEEPRTADVRIPVRVSLRQLYKGEVLDVQYSRQVVCPEASQCTQKSSSCQGPGVSMRTQQLAPGFVQQVQVHDSSCIARGKAWKPGCKACPKGMTEEEEIELTLDVQAGMADGSEVKYDNVADEAPGHIAGDLIFVITQIPDNLFRRKGDDLEMTMQISLLDSLVGFETTFPHLDGHEVKVVKETVTYCSEVYKVIGQGMPRKGSKKGFGDLYITLTIKFPDQFTPKQKTEIRKALTA